MISLKHVDLIGGSKSQGGQRFVKLAGLLENTLIFLQQQQVYKQLALRISFAKQLLGLNNVVRNNNIKSQFKKNIYYVSKKQTFLSQYLIYQKDKTIKLLVYLFEIDKFE